MVRLPIDVPHASTGAGIYQGFSKKGADPQDNSPSLRPTGTSKTGADDRKPNSEDRPTLRRLG